MIVEVGTSDFRTQAGLVEGIFIEPVKYYFDRLPKCNKLNIAISNYTGETDVYYIPWEVIEEQGLPNWLRGCNSINEPHKTVVSMGLQKYVKVDKVKVERIADVIKGVKKIDVLKIDTEGHDTVILNDYLDTVDVMPKKIIFESNELSSKEDVMKVIDRLKAKGYDCQQVYYDMICTI
jgi:hypothetical protein